MPFNCKLTGLLVGILACPSTVGAHALEVACSLKAGRLEVLARFDSGDPAEGAMVQIMDHDRQILAEGQIDAKGLCTLPAPPLGKYRVIVDDGAGHREVVHITELTTTIEAAPRDRFWLKVVLGLGVIGALALAAIVALRGKRNAPTRGMSRESA